MAKMLTDLADVLRAAGLKVVEMPGWKTRARPGAFTPRGVLCHHTAGTSDSRAYIEWMIGGRTDLPGPLAQIGLSRTGIAYVMAAGRANHGGKMKAIAGLPAGDGNATLIGIEAMNTGFEGWSPAQYAAYVLICAALNNHYGWPASRTLGHKETSLSGKIDPGKMSMPDFRADVARKMAALKQPSAPAVPGAYPGAALKRGATGPKVSELQKALGLSADGSYGPGTETAIRAHQTAHGLTVDGITGPSTWASIFTQEDDDMQLTDKFTLPKIDGVIYSNPETNVGAALGASLGYILQTRNRQDAQFDVLTSHIATLTAAVTVLADARPDVDTAAVVAAIEKAGDDAAARVAKAFDAIDVQVTTTEES